MTGIEPVRTTKASEVMSGERLYIDCEFNGFGGELISMALVGDDGREWYAVLPEPRIWDAWCFEHVLPMLDKEAPTIRAISREEFRVSLRCFLDQYQNPIIVADWYVDLVHFFSAFAGRDHSESMPVNCRAELVLDLPDLQPTFPHNALSDARAIAAARAGSAI